MKLIQIKYLGYSLIKKKSIVIFEYSIIYTFNTHSFGY